MNEQKGYDNRRAVQSRTGRGRLFPFRPAALLLALLLPAILAAACTADAAKYDIVIYGGSFAGCAAARTAAQAAPDKSILLVVPDPVPALGGTGTIGGQNFFDIRLWHNQLVTGGSFARWYSQTGQFYNTAAMAELLREDLAGHANISILWSHDIEAVDTASHPRRIISLKLRTVVRRGDGFTRWGVRTRRVWGRVFIDASDDGRLVRLAGLTTTAGRHDWPVVHLDSTEQDRWGALTGRRELARQQAATLMFKVKGVAVPSLAAGRTVRMGDLIFTRSPSGTMGMAGGNLTFRENPVVRAFNHHYGPLGFALKPFNAAQDGPGSDQWWVNTLLIFNVDGRANLRDRGTGRYPAVRPDYMDVDTARLKAIEMLKEPAFLEALRQFSAVDPHTGRRYGFQRAELVADDRGNPVVGDILYLRETVHLPLEERRAGHDSEDTNYALTAAACQGAGGTNRTAGKQRKGRDGKGGVNEDTPEAPSKGPILKSTKANSGVSGGRSAPVAARTGPDRVEANPGPKHYQEETAATNTRSPGKEQAASWEDLFKGTEEGKNRPTGADEANYPDRIGLGYYTMDINAYSYADMQSGTNPVWPVTGILRPDWQSRGGNPVNPVYLPYRMLVTPRAENLLVPGYATGACSLAWAEIRVIPNLCVLGDAAGAAAARAVLFGEMPARFGPEQIRWVQETLRRAGARLEK